MMNFVPRFLRGKWLEKARLYALNPQKLKQLLPQLGKYLSKDGLLSAKTTLQLMKNYLADISAGRYKEYDIKKLIVIVGAIIYVITPIDLLPDLLPPGLIDDLSIVAWALKEAAAELEKYKNWKQLASNNDRLFQEEGAE